MNEYKHTQIGYSLINSYTFVFLVIGVVNIVTEFAPLALLALIFILLTISTFASLTVTVDKRVIGLRFGVGIIRKEFKLADIERYQAVENPWYYLSGIRYTPRGWLFAVSGDSAVELEMKNGKYYRIGTDEPEKLIQALDRAIAAA
ncbi:MAG TPA: hypothetical protein VLE70_12835 [Anaerolineae bacterium]|jgi:hypothetical protein|nr:hypothetical protein [Anaerolineae bacterium]